MGFQRVFNGFSMGFQWVFNELSVVFKGFQWVFKGFSMGFQWFSRVGQWNMGKTLRNGAKKSSGIWFRAGKKNGKNLVEYGNNSEPMEV
jgi:hypothetical protein